MLRTPAGNLFYTFHGMTRYNGLGAGSQKLMWRAHFAGASFYYRRLTVRPVRIG